MRIPVLLLLLISLVAHGQGRRQPDAGKIKLNLKKLNTLGAVLYMAAHPDDENTRVITYLVNDRQITTGYLSLTRGDGGQNLIGPEMRDLLGLIRTQELLSARGIDGGQQFFTRANDFGFSKSAKETFEIWNKEAVFSDVIKVIREFQPDVIITRFPPDERAGHGHHTASAILAQEAFDQSANPNVFPDQARTLGTWQVKRVFVNTGRWWNQTINEQTPGVVVMNVGTYNPLLGESYPELAADSRTQHKSQGFGSWGRRGDALEYFELARGEKAEKDVLDGVNTRWTRLKGGEKVEPLVTKAIQEFNIENPSASVPLLLQIRTEISRLDHSVWRTRKLADVDQLIQDCLALFIESTTNQYWVAPGEAVTTTFEFVNRSNIDVQLKSIHAPDLEFDSVFVAPLPKNASIFIRSPRRIRSGREYSGPYWLKDKHSQGLFTVNDPDLIGKPESDPAVMVEYTFLVNGEKLIVRSPLVYKWNDPVKGEQGRPFEIVPIVGLNIMEKVILFPDASPRNLRVLITSAASREIAGVVRLSLPSGWKAEPAEIPFSCTGKGQELQVTFTVTPKSTEESSVVNAIATVEGKQFDKSIQVISYDHIPTQTLLPKSEAKVLRLDLKKEGAVVGYIRGAGDETAAGLRNMGYQVWEMKDEEITSENLKKVDAVVLGVRTLNTNERIRHFMPDLFEYVKGGGTVITQYNTTQELGIDRDKIAPYPLSLSRDRVTEENSEVRILKPDHVALNYPNKISTGDFEGWIQERGLNFPDKWDEHFDALLSCNDTGESPKDGSLLVARYGEGYYVYTSLSFFRELPEGVPGAYRLFANLVSLGKMRKPDNAKVKAKAK